MDNLIPIIFGVTLSKYKSHPIGSFNGFIPFCTRITSYIYNKSIKNVLNISRHMSLKTCQQDCVFEDNNQIFNVLCPMLRIIYPQYAAYKTCKYLAEKTNILISPPPHTNIIGIKHCFSTVVGMSVLIEQP